MDLYSKSIKDKCLSSKANVKIVVNIKKLKESIVLAQKFT